MALSLGALTRLRPYLFHLTARENLARIRRCRILESTARLATRAEQLGVLQTRRRDHMTVLVDGERVVLRDQAPLHAGNMRLDEGWSFSRFVRHLNDRVFFWPGGEGGPIAYGVRHFQRYESEVPVILRVPFSVLLDENRGATPELCRYNSGSPRWSRGVAAPRGEQTFVLPETAVFGAAQVVEVTFRDLVQLPASTAVAACPTGPWQPLFT